MNQVILANHMISLITSSTRDPWYWRFKTVFNENKHVFFTGAIKTE